MATEIGAGEARGVVQDGSLIDLLGLETLLGGGGEEGVQEVETTEQTIAVKTTASSTSSDDPVEGSVVAGNSGGAWEQGSTEAISGTVEQSSSVSATLSTESLLEEGGQHHQHITLTSTSAKEADPSLTSSSIGSSSQPPVISASSSQQMSSSLVATPSLPRHRMTTTQAAELMITTTELNDEELNPWQEVAQTNMHLTDYDFRAKYPMTDYTIEASKPIVKMERTEPSYDKENPNRVGLADGEIDPDLDHFLSHEAPLKSGGPLNTTWRSKADNEAQNRMDVVGNDELRKSDRRAEPGPDINDILSGLLNVVGEGLHFATNYVKENNKKKLQEKLDAELAEEESKNVVPEKGVNRTRVNNRGPPLGDLKDKTFEAVPLRPPPGVKPGAKPVAIPQRPFR